MPGGAGVSHQGRLWRVDGWVCEVVLTLTSLVLVVAKQALFYPSIVLLQWTEDVSFLLNRSRGRSQGPRLGRA
jgi:hypothetical protein